MERKVVLLKMLVFWNDGRLLSQRPLYPFLEWSEGFMHTQEAAEQRKGGVSPVTAWV